MTPTNIKKRVVLKGRSSDLIVKVVAREEVKKEISPWLDDWEERHKKCKKEN